MEGRFARLSDDRSRGGKASPHCRRLPVPMVRIRAPLIYSGLQACRGTTSQSPILHCDAIFGSVMRTPQWRGSRSPCSTALGGDQFVVPARAALHLYEIARPEILDPFS